MRDPEIGNGTTLPRTCGELPAWEVTDLPGPPPFNSRNLIKVIGPGAVMAATSIGGGEWLVGPAAAVKYTTSIFLIVTVAIALQTAFNLEAIRYTLYTGEPIFGGIMRLKPGPRFWAVFYTIIGFFQLGWPALAGSAAATLLSAWMGRVPEGGDREVLAWIATALIGLVVLILSFGGTIERMLEYFAWTMLALVFLFLIVVNVAFVPLGHWGVTFLGFFQFTGLPRPIDWALIGALAATAGSGGLGNLTVTNWVRDKGFGMGAKVGAIPGLGAVLLPRDVSERQPRHLHRSPRYGSSGPRCGVLPGEVPRREDLARLLVPDPVLFLGSLGDPVSFAVPAVQIYVVNRRFLPRAVRPARWRELALLGCAAFYAFFSYFAIRALLRSLLA